MNGEIITIGDELLIGQVVNTNQAYIAGKLNEVGIYVERMTTIGDSEEKILTAFREGLERYDVICVTGGLGPTHDDITKNVVCKFFGTDLIQNSSVLERVKKLMAGRNISWTKSAEDQALVPRSCTVIDNKNGTAPGMLFEPPATPPSKYFIVMPGVPYEMQGMMDDWIVPYFAGKNLGTVVRHRTLKTTGIPESFLATEIGDVNNILDPDGSTTLAFLPSPMGTRLRITVRDYKDESAGAKLNATERKIREKVEKYIYSSSDKDLEDVVGDLLKEKKLTLAVAESCTGGLIANRITNVSGSSEYFERGYVTYSNRSKIETLSVPADILDQRGAVSKEVAEAMASGVRKNSGADIGISTTGIAGPTGGTPEKPVGLIYIGYADATGSLAMKFNFGDNRLRFKERASQAALELLRRKLLKIS
jgi:competence/damage-inducible protein CinA-like protein